MFPVLENVELEEIEDTQEIRGVLFPAGYKYRQFIITGPPGSGKSTIVRRIRGWPLEGYIDLSSDHWWQSRELSYRPREVHFGLPFVGHKNALTVFDREWMEAAETLEIDVKRIKIPSDGSMWSLIDWRHRYVFEFVLPPADLAFGWRQERAKSGLYPADARLTERLVQLQNDIYLSTAVFLQEWGLQVYVRHGFEGPPLRILTGGRDGGQWSTPYQRPRLSGLIERAPFLRASSLAELTTEYTQADKKTRIAFKSTGVRLRFGSNELWAVPDRPILDLKTGYPRDWLLLKPDQMASGIFGRIRIGNRREVDVGWDNKEARKLFGFSEDMPPVAFELENDRGDLLITLKNNRHVLELAALGSGECLDAERLENLKKVEAIFGSKIDVLKPDEALDTARAAAPLFARETYRPLTSEGRPGGVIELPEDLAPIILGDLHGRVDNLVKALCENNFLSALEKGTAYLVLLGDVVHSEDDDQLEEMASSALMLDLIFKLKLRFPEQVFMLRGNHESFTSEMAKGGVPQGLLFEMWLKKERGQHYVSWISRFFDSLPYVIKTDRYIAAHAGPTRSQVDFSTLVNVDKYPGIIHELTWNRIRKPNHPIGYTKGDVRRFRKNLGVEVDTPFIVGHTPQSRDETFWTKAGNIRRHYIVYSARKEAFGVVVRVEDRMIAMDYNGEALVSVDPEE